VRKKDKTSVGEVGETLRATIEVMGWDQKTLARVLGRPVQVVCEVVNGTKRITADTARQLEAAGLGDAIYWLQLQAAQELRGPEPPGLKRIAKRALVARNKR
jgi:HTH-type transcriptional regulator/antitoxin HigA